MNSKSLEKIKLVMDAPIQKIKSFCSNKKNIISLAQGVPWFGPPKDALQRAIERIKNGEGDKYGADEGTQELRYLLSDFLIKIKIKNPSMENIIVTPGANQGAFIALATLTNTGDEIILFRPFYFNHFMAVQILGLNPVIVNTDENYHIIPELLENKITKRTKAMIVVSPSNPSGAMVDKEVWEELIRISHKYGIYIISDEPYFHFTWEKEHISPLTIEEELIIGLWSFSKSYGMSGWRIGFMKAPSNLVTHLIKVADTLHVCTPLPSQILAEEVLKTNMDYPFQFLPEMKNTRDELIHNLVPLAKEKIIDFPKSEGGFYIFLKLNNIKYSGWEFAKILIDRYGIATVPGEAFGMESESFIRLSFGNLRVSEMKKASRILKNSLISLLEI